MYAFNVYRDFALEAAPPTRSSSASIRARPLPGQGLPTDMYVECSRSMRNHLDAETVAIIRGQVTCKEGGTPFLWTYHSAPYELISRKEAEEMIARGELGFPEN